MKTSLLALGLLLILTACQSAAAQSVAEISYSSRTRGGLKEVRLTPTEVHFTAEGNQWSAPIPASVWEQVTAWYAQSETGALTSAQAPTLNRASDGAWHSSFTVTLPDGTQVQSQTFDNLRAPKPWQALADLLRTLDAKHNQEATRLFSADF